MIEYGSKVVDDLVAHDGELWRHWFDLPEGVDVAALPLVDLRFEGPGLFSRCPGRDKRIASVDPLFRPLELGLDSGKSVDGALPSTRG